VNFLRSKAEHLADHLRSCIARGELPATLPPIREWSGRLGVSHGTLEEALRILKRESLVRAQPGKGLRVAAKVARSRPATRMRLVRCIARRANYRDVPAWAEVFGAISQRLESKGIHFSLEFCNSDRLRTIHDEGENPNEMLLFASVPQQWLLRFSDFRRSVLLIGTPAASITLPFISVDMVPALRHAVYLLARHGFDRISLVLNQGARKFMEDEFHGACTAVPRPVHGEVVRLPDELYRQIRSAERLAARMKGRHGLITCSPISPALLMTALMRRGFAVPDQIEVVAVTVFAQQLRTVPVPIHYPYPVEKLADQVTRAAVHYFEQGALPPLRKLVPLEMATPDEQR